MYIKAQTSDIDRSSDIKDFEMKEENVKKTQIWVLVKTGVVK